jgi:hypothetical protein
MATYKSDICEYPSLRPAATSSQAGVLLASVGAASLDTNLASGDIVQLCKLPEGHEPVDFQLESSALDDGAGITLSVGVLNADGDDLVANTNFLTDDTTAQTGGVARADVIDGLGLAAGGDRIIAAKVTTVAATPAAGTLRGKLVYCENP